MSGMSVPGGQGLDSRLDQGGRRTRSLVVPLLVTLLFLTIGLHAQLVLQPALGSLDPRVHHPNRTGPGSIDFGGDSRGIANILCRDFEANPEVQGTAAPGTHPVPDMAILLVASSARRPAPLGSFNCGMVLEPARLMGQPRQRI
jgi:hypothetical protein